MKSAARGKVKAASAEATKSLFGRLELLKLLLYSIYLQRPNFKIALADVIFFTSLSTPQAKLYGHRFVTNAFIDCLLIFGLKKGDGKTQRDRERGREKERALKPETGEVELAKLDVLQFDSVTKT